MTFASMGGDRGKFVDPRVGDSDRTPIDPTASASMGQLHSQEVVEILREAGCAATRMGHTYVGTEHLILGVVAVPNSGLTLLEAAAPVEIRGSVVQAVRDGLSAIGMIPDSLNLAEPVEAKTTMTDRSRQVLKIARAVAESRVAESKEPVAVTGEHLAIALFKEGGGVAANVLKNLKFSPQRLQEAAQQSARVLSPRLDD